jgi:hypothetical protein
MQALALIEESLDPREGWTDGDPLPRWRPDARRARLRLMAARGDVDVDAVADALVRRLRFTAALRAELASDG